MTRVGIIRCQEQSTSCAGFHCFPALREKAGSFTGYRDIELVGFDTCGGCGRGKADKIVAKAKRLVQEGAEVIHLGNCLIGSCPFKNIYIKALKEQAGITIVENTHPVH